MNLDIQVNFTDSFNKKLNSMAYVESCSEAIEEVTNDLLEEVKSECPVRTGNLRDGHFSSTTILRGNIHNHVEYAPYVIYGTSRQAPNNYPQRAYQKVMADDKIISYLIANMKAHGLL